jgi:outer membrane autotransporter protein
VGFTNGGEKFSWGVAAGHQDSDLNFTGGNGEQEGWNMGLYGSWQSKSTYLTGILGYGKYDNDIYDGDISSFDTKATSASLEIGKHLSDDKKGGFTPYASVLWTKIKQDSASGDEGLVLKNGSNNIFTTELGVRYNHRMFDENDSLKGGWMAGLSWLHQGGDTGLPVNVGFAGVDGNASVKGTPLAGNSLRVQLGAYGRIHGNLIGFAGYQGTFGSSQKINAVNAGIGYQF